MRPASTKQENNDWAASNAAALSHANLSHPQAQK
jgi:hypothetical protein